MESSLKRWMDAGAASFPPRPSKKDGEFWERKDDISSVQFNWGVSLMKVDTWTLSWPCMLRPMQHLQQLSTWIHYGSSTFSLQQQLLLQRLVSWFMNEILSHNSEGWGHANNSIIFCYSWLFNWKDVRSCLKNTNLVMNLGEKKAWAIIVQSNMSHDYFEECGARGEC